MIQDFRTLHEPNCDSDHFLVNILITQKLVRTQRNNNTQRKQRNRKNLQNKEKLKQYRQSSRNNQHHALICTTPLFYILAPTRFGSSLPSSGSFLNPSELLHIQTE
jgi:hypothetical protein